MFHEGRNSERESHRKKDKFVPLDEVRSDVVSVTLPLPPYVQGVGMNVKALETMCRIAGIKNLRIVGKANGDEVSTTQHAFSGLNADGTTNKVGVAAKTIVQEATSDLTRDNDGQFHWRAKSWGDVRIEINTAEMAQRIREEDTPRGVADSNMWARHINNAILTELGRRGAQQLIRGGTLGNDILTVFSTFVQGIPSGFDANLLDGLMNGFHNDFLYHPHPLTTPKDFEWFVESVIFYNVWNYIYYLVGLGRRGGEKMRLSILGPAAPELDRAAVLKAMEGFRRRFPVVKVITQKEKNSD